MSYSESMAGTHTMPPLSRAVFALAMILLAWETRRQTRRTLARLEGHLLQDIGVSRGRAMAEAAKPFWKV